MDETKIVPLTLEYQENNYYHTSQIQDEINIDLIPIDINIEVSLNKRGYNINDQNNEKYYYKDSINITVQACIAENTNYIVNEGSFNFYFVKNDDNTQYEFLINPSPIPVDNMGYASINFIPRGSGQIVVKYNGDGSFFKDEEVFQEIIVHSLPTKVEFLDNYPIFIDPEHTVDLHVKVTVDEIDDPTPVSYGVVTFLHYWTEIEDNYNGSMNNPLFDKAVIIGNPVFLNENGEGVIKYSPMQVYSIDINDLYQNIEVIRAYYNYDNNDYEELWDYYEGNSDYIAISISKSNYLNVASPIHSVNEVDTNLDIKDGVFQANSGEGIKFVFWFTDGDNNIVDFSETWNIDHNKFNSIFKTIFSGAKTNIPVNFTYDDNPNSNYYQKFVANANAPSNKGLYTFYVEVDQEAIQRLIDEDQRYDVLYMNQQTSEPIYINIKHEESSDIILEIEKISTNMNESYIIGSNENVKIKVTANSMSNDGEEQYLHNSPCHIDVGNTTIDGTLIYNNGECSFTTDNIGSLFTNEMEYNIQAYTDSGDRQFGESIKTFNKIYSNQITIYARKPKNYNISFPKGSSIEYLENVDFGVSWAGESQNDSINSILKISKNSEEIDSKNIQVGKEVTTYSYPNLDVGTYEIKISNNDPRYQMSDKKDNFTITAKHLSLYTLNNTNEILTIPEAISQNLTLYSNKIKKDIDKLIEKANNITFEINNETYNSTVVQSNNQILFNINNITTLQKKGTYDIEPTNNNNITFDEYPQVKVIDNPPVFKAQIKDGNIEIIMTNYDGDPIDQNYTLTIYRLINGVEGDYSFGVNGKNITTTTTEEGYKAVIITLDDVPNWTLDDALTSCAEVEFSYQKTNDNYVIGYSSTDGKTIEGIMG